MENFRRGDWVTWTRPSNGAQERARVIDLSIDQAVVCIEVEGHRPYWVLVTHLEHADPPEVPSTYTSPDISGAQLERLIDDLTEAWKSRSEACRIRIVESSRGLEVQVLPPGPNEPVF